MTRLPIAALLVATLVAACGTDAGTDGGNGADGGTSGGADGGSGGGGGGGGGVVTGTSDAVQIIVEPSDRGQGLISAISQARRSVHMTMYLLSSSDVISALISAHKAGREVKVILNKTFPDTNSNQTSFNQLAAGGVDVHWSSSAYTFTHEKCVIVDGSTAWIMTMNAATSALTSNREYLAVDTDDADVAESEAIFAADFAGTTPTLNGRLLVAPVNARDRMLDLIDFARSSLDVEGEELSDYKIVAELGLRASQGVTVRVVLEANDVTNSSEASAIQQLKSKGAKVVAVKSPYIHAKALVADGARAYVGSANFTTGSLQHNRELGLITANRAAVQAVASTIAGDFAKGVAQ